MKTKGPGLALITIWVMPGATVRGLCAANSGKGLAMIVPALFGASQVRPFVVRQQAESGPVEWTDWIGAGFAGAICGIAGLFLFAWLFRNFARWFSGSGNLGHARTALGWGLLPMTLLFAVLLVMTFVAPEWIDRSEQSFTPLIALIAVFFVYGYAVLLLSLAAGQNLSVLRAFAALVVTFLVSVFPITIVIQIAASLVG